MESKTGPLVTVLISTFNRRRYFAEALRSIVGQTYRNIQVIAVNDGGEPVSDVVSAIADPRAILIDRRENRGLAYSFNQALQYAKGKYVAYLGDDDLFYPHHVERLVETLEGDTDCQVAYSDLYKVHCRIEPDGSRTVLGKVVNISRDFDRCFLLHYNHTLHVAMMHRLDLLAKTGPYNENIRVLIDWDMTRRLAFFSDFVHIREITGEFYAPVTGSDRISYRMRKDRSDYIRNMLNIRSSRPPKPWPKMKDLSIIVAPDAVDTALSKQMRDIWLWTFATFRMIVAQTVGGLAKLQTEMPNVVRLPVQASDSPHKRIDQALAACDSEYVAIVHPHLPIRNAWVENPLFALWHHAQPRVAFMPDDATDQCWSIVARTDELREARRRYPTMSVRGSLESANFTVRTPTAQERPFAFDNQLAKATTMEEDGMPDQAALMYEDMQQKLPNADWMKERQAEALFKTGKADDDALKLCREINAARVTPQGLLLEARVLKRMDRAAEAADALEHARIILTQTQQ